MPTPELVKVVVRAADEVWLRAVHAVEQEDRPVYPRDIIRQDVIPAALKAHEEWLAERIPVMAEAIRLALETGDNVPACLPDLCKYEPCACCEVAAKAAISAALAEE